MKQLKRISIVFCAAVLLIMGCTFNANALILSDGDFGYEINTYSKYATLAEYTGTDTSVEIPSEYSGFPVRKISQRAFANNATIETVSFPTTIRSLENRAFMDCKSLKNVSIPSYITELGSELFANCTSLQAAGVYTTVVPERCFTGCSSLSEISYFENVKTIEAYAFQNCTALSNTDFISNVSQIKHHAFECSGITKVDIPNSIVEITAYSFANCANLNRVNIPKTVNAIDSTAFFNDPNLTLAVWYGTAGYDYAIAQNTPYVLLDNVLLGDASGDGSVNINDVTTIQRHLAELETLEGIYLHAADANQDGTVDIADATALQMYIAEYDLPYPIGEVMTQ